jgi:hypothetical protein
MKVPLPPRWTTPSTFWAATAASTDWRLGWFWNMKKNSVPPWKSMPSRKPLKIMEKTPGMMTTSEIAK